MIENSSEVSWPLTFVELIHQQRDAPKIMQKLYDYLLAGDLHHETSEKKNKLLNKSFCSDVICVLSNGKFLTSKHRAVGLGLHSLTGLKQTVVYLSKPRHSVSYKQMEEIQKVQKELALNLSNESRILPLVPMDSNKKVNDYTFQSFKIWMKKTSVRNY